METREIILGPDTPLGWYRVVNTWGFVPNDLVTSVIELVSTDGDCLLSNGTKWKVLWGTDLEPVAPPVPTPVAEVGESVLRTTTALLARLITDANFNGEEVPIDAIEEELRNEYQRGRSDLQRVVMKAMEDAK